MQNVIILSSHKKTAVQTGLRGSTLPFRFWREAVAGDSWAGRKRAGLLFSGPIGPLGRTKALARDPTPHSDLGEQPWSHREDIIPSVREVGAGEGFSQEGLSRRGVGEDSRNISKKSNVSPEAECKKKNNNNNESKCISGLLWEVGVFD